MTKSLSERMVVAAGQYGIVPPDAFEDLVVFFGRGIGDKAIFNDLESGLYRGIRKKYSKDHVLQMLGLILEVDVLLDLAVERSLQAHKFVQELDQASGDASARRMVAHMNLGPNEMKNSVFHAIKGLRANLEQLDW